MTYVDPTCEQLKHVDLSKTVTATAMDRQDHLRGILKSSLKLDNDHENLVTALVAASEAVVKISSLLSNYVQHDHHEADGHKAGTTNLSGDEQLILDLKCDSAVFEACRENASVFGVVATEETPIETKINESSSEQQQVGTIYSMACDPLDGSSIIDANFSVGSIFGFWPGSTLVGKTGRELAAAAMSVFGPRTTLLFSTHTDNVEVTLTGSDGQKRWEVSRTNIAIAESGKIMAPGNLRAITSHPDYNNMVQYWLQKEYQLRYTGGMVPDIYHIFSKEKGIFANVTTPGKKAKLRLLYEVAPVALLMKSAGGMAILDTLDSNHSVVDILDIAIEHTDHRVGVCMGSTKEVETFKQIMFETK